MDLTHRVPMNRNIPPAQVSGTRCTLHSAQTLERATFHATQSRPAQPIRPSGTPIPQTTILMKGKTSAGRFVHCSPGGPPPFPLDSEAATFMLSTHSGLGLRVRSVVLPLRARNDIGWVTRNV